MFLIRNQALHWSLRQNRNIFKDPHQHKTTATSSASQQPTKPVEKDAVSDSKSVASFPYKFGGISVIPQDHPQLGMLLPKKGPFFCSIYQNFLRAIQEKNSKDLQKIVPPQLIAPLLNKDIQTNLLGKGKEGRLVFHRLDIFLGESFERSGKKFTNNAPPDAPTGLFVPENLNPFDGEVSVLLSLSATIRSPTRLVLKGSDESEREEAHGVCFEVQTIYGLQDMMAMAAKIPMARFSKDPQQISKFLYKDDSIWKLGNIDGFLKPRC